MKTITTFLWWENTVIHKIEGREIVNIGYLMEGAEKRQNAIA